MTTFKLWQMHCNACCQQRANHVAYTGLLLLFSWLLVIVIVSRLFAPCRLCFHSPVHSCSDSKAVTATSVNFPLILTFPEIYILYGTGELPWTVHYLSMNTWGRPKTASRDIMGCIGPNSQDVGVSCLLLCSRILCSYLVKISLHQAGRCTAAQRSHAHCFWNTPTYPTSMVTST